MKRRTARHARYEFADRVGPNDQSLVPASSRPTSETATPTAPSPDPSTTALAAEATARGGSTNANKVTPAPRAPSAPARAAKGATRTSVLDALAKGGAMTAAEVALAAGLGRATASSTLSRLTRTGEVAKAERGYKLSEAVPRRGAAGNSRPSPPTSSRPSTTKAKVLTALANGEGLTAGDVAAATGLARGTVSTLLSRLAKSGDVVKADRGYRLPG